MVNKVTVFPEDWMEQIVAIHFPKGGGGDKFKVWVLYIGRLGFGTVMFGKIELPYGSPVINFPVGGLGVPIPITDLVIHYSSSGTDDIGYSDQFFGSGIPSEMTPVMTWFQDTEGGFPSARTFAGGFYTSKPDMTLIAEMNNPPGLPGTEVFLKEFTINVDPATLPS